MLSLGPDVGGEYGPYRQVLILALTAECSLMI